jgi:predicted nucleotidyltransferase
MRKHDAVVALTQQTDAIRALGATSFYLFGSTAHGTELAGSDLDLFVDYDRDGRFSLVELVVDVTTRDSLDPLLRSEIEASAEPIF